MSSPQGWTTAGDATNPWGKRKSRRPGDRRDALAKRRAVAPGGRIRPGLGNGLVAIDGDGLEHSREKGAVGAREWSGERIRKEGDGVVELREEGRDLCSERIHDDVDCSRRREMGVFFFPTENFLGRVDSWLREGGGFFS